MGKNLTFGQALELLKEGMRIKRKDWGGYWILEGVHSNLGEIQEDVIVKNYRWLQIVAVLKDNGGYAPAQPYQADMLAEDWEVVE